MWIEKAKIRTDLNDFKLLELLKINQEVEWQAGYDFTDNLSIVARIMDVDFNNVDNQGYRAFESRIQFKF